MDSGPVRRSSQAPLPKDDSNLVVKDCDSQGMSVQNSMQRPSLGPPSQNSAQDGQTVPFPRSSDRRAKARGDDDLRQSESLQAPTMNSWIAEEGNPNNEIIGGKHFSKKFLDSVLPVDFLEAEMSNEVRDSKLVGELLVFVPFIVLFLLTTLLPLDIQATHMAVASLRSVYANKPFPTMLSQTTGAFAAINTTANYKDAAASLLMSPDKMFTDIANQGDWGDWLRMVMEETWRCGDISKDPPPTAPNNITRAPRDKSADPPFPGFVRTSRAGGYLLGAMRVRTQRAAQRSCQIHKDVRWSNDNITRDVADVATCFGPQDSVSGRPEERLPAFCNIPHPDPQKNETLFRWRPCSEVSGSPITTEFNLYHCGGYILDIPFHVSCADATKYLDALVNDNCPFVDNRATRLAVVEFFAYFPNEDVHISAKLINEVTSGGGWLPQTQFRAFRLWTPRLVVLSVIEFVFLVFVLYYAFAFFANLAKYYREERKILGYFFNFWAMLEFVNVVTYMVNFGFRWAWWDSSSKLEHALKMPVAAAYPDFDEALFRYSMVRYTNAFNFVLTFLKILKYLRISSKLNIIALTFEKSKADVLGLLVLFVFVVVGYSVAGTSMFGPQLKDFASLDRSFSTLIFMLLGQLDYAGMKAVNATLAGFYFWTYLILSFFLILNFIIAVIGEAFADAGHQQWVPTLADAALVTIDNFLYSVHPREFLKRLRLLCRRRKSVESVRAQMLMYIRQNRTVLHLKHPAALVINVTAREVLKWVPISDRADYSEFFLRDWYEMSTMFDLQSRSSEEQVARTRKEALAKGARNALGTVDTTLSTLDDQLVSLEESLAKMAFLLGGGKLHQLGVVASPHASPAASDLHSSAPSYVGRGTPTFGKAGQGAVDTNQVAFNPILRRIRERRAELLRQKAFA